MEIVILPARIALLKRLIAALKLQQRTTSTQVSGRAPHFLVSKANVPEGKKVCLLTSFQRTFEAQESRKPRTHDQKIRKSR